MKLIFASHNANKVREIQDILGNEFELLCLKDLLFTEDIPETSSTLEGNSKIKADAVYKRFKTPCFADDTGLEVKSLNGAPGVYSARYAGENKNAEDNMNLLLANLKSHTNRQARFRTVITYKSSKNTHQFEGIVEGQIILQKTGEHGFGYDPIFVPNGSEKTFGEMSILEKNTFSHRARAFEKFRLFLNES